MHTRRQSTTDPNRTPPAAVYSAVDPETAWQQILARDPAAGFVYAVTTTGVFCRPGCSSRRPLRTNTRFFPTAEVAIAAGFRPCLRCRPAIPMRDPVRMLREHIEQNFDRRVSLAELARVADLSKFTVQRLFKREMGASPLAYQRALRSGSLRSALKKGRSVTDAVYFAGFGSSSRAYDSLPLGMAPARFAKGGRGERIGYTIGRTPFGWILVAATERGLCWLSLAATKAEAEAALHAEFPAATLWPDALLSAWVEAAVKCVSSTASQTPDLDLRGTAFQLRVWDALRRIPRGETRTYSQLAREMGMPKSTRAVARACATNRIALLVPCHRVVGASGSLTGYRWGIERKKRILAAERD
jgi:AraC family transcriptional regulator of adaptative response/methylated-DNA-[protein]-cysteine methyltransferase